MPTINEIATIKKVISETATIKKVISETAILDIVIGEVFSNSISTLFDGVDEFANINSLQVATASQTVATWSVWLKAVDASPFSEERLIAFTDASGLARIQLDIKIPGELRVLGHDGTATQFIIETSNPVFTDNTWGHAAVVFDGILPVLYVNGIKVAQNTIISTDTTFFFNNTSLINTGRLADYSVANLGETNHFNGNIDEVRFWNVAKSVAQIVADFNDGAPGDPDTTGLVTNYRMGDNDTFPTLTDNTSNNNGTLVNMESGDFVADVPPSVGFINTLSTLFDGVDERVDVPDDASLNFERTDPFSISHWIQLNSLGSLQIFSSRRAEIVGLVGWVIHTNPSNIIRFLFAGTGPTILQVQSTSVISDNNWHNYVITYDGSSNASGVKIYIDGVSDTLSVLNDALSTSTLVSSQFKLAVDRDNSGELNGNMDENSIWDKELTSGEVTALYNNGKPVDLLTHSANANLVLWLRMGDGDIFPTLTDNSTNTNDGTMVNMEIGDFVTDVP